MVVRVCALVCACVCVCVCVRVCLRVYTLRCVHGEERRGRQERRGKAGRGVCMSGHVHVCACTCPRVCPIKCISFTVCGQYSVELMVPPPPPRTPPCTAERMSEQIALARKRKVECNYFFRRECPGTLRDNMCDRDIGTIKNVVMRAS